MDDSLNLFFSLQLPVWINGFLADHSREFSAIEDRMRLAIGLSRQNTERKTGGPFGAAIFEQNTGKLVSVGVNIVVPGQCSLAHAEMMAIGLAQKTLDTHDLGSCGNYQLVTSCAPCAMCLGAIPWSGVRSLVCGARGEDAESVGFDEGAKPNHWIDCLKERHIDVTVDILRQEAAEVLQLYQSQNGTCY